MSQPPPGGYAGPPRYGGSRYGRSQYGGPGQPPNPYPYPGQGHPPPGQPFGGRGRPPRPQSVQTSFLLWLGAIAVSLLGFVVSLGGARDEIRQSGGGLPPGAADQAATVGIAVAVVLGLILGAAFTALVVLMRSGRNWARITLTVLSAIWLLLAVIGLVGQIVGVAATGQGVVSFLTGLVTVALTVAAIVLMYRPDANAYFGHR